MKTVTFLGSSKKDLGSFPEGARKVAGYELFMVQIGQEPSAPPPGIESEEMKTKQDPRVTGPHEVVEAHENIFEALGFAGGEAAELLMRAQLMAALGRWLKDSQMTQAEAAKLLGVTQARVSDPKRGKFNLFSLDMLVRLADQAGLKPELRLAGTVRAASAPARPPMAPGGPSAAPAEVHPR